MKTTRPEVDYSIFTSAERLTLVRHPAMVALKGRLIGPLFPELDEGAKRGMRGTPRKATKSSHWDTYRQKRKEKKRGY